MPNAITRMGRSGLAALGKLAGLGYARDAAAGRKRDLRLDILRGFCVLVMVVDHIGGEPSVLYAITGGNRFYVSAAEGFVLLSGIAMGMVYADLLVREGPGAALARALRRSRLLYALTVSLTIVFASLSFLLGSPWTRDVTQAQPIEFAVGVLTLHRSYSLTDVLLLYTVLVLAAGPLLVLFARGRTALVLASSWTLWGIWQVVPGQLVLPWPIVDEGFPLAPWQAVFVTGLAVGYHRKAIARALGPHRATLAWIGAASLSAALVIGYVHGSLPRAGIEFDQLFGKDDMRVGRVVALATFTVGAYGVVSALWLAARPIAGWLLLPLGQNALTAYTVHLFVTAAAASALAEPLRRDAGHAFVQVAGVLVVWAVLPLVARRATALGGAAQRKRETTARSRTPLVGVASAPAMAMSAGRIR